MAKLKTFNYTELSELSELSEQGFRGFVAFANIRPRNSQGDGGIPKSPGVYVVLRASTGERQFLPKGFGGTHKARKANVSLEELEANWVPGAGVLYIGKASQRENGGLWDRINEYAIAGQGHSHGHSGGQYIWQMADARDLLVAWKVVPDKTEKKLEEAMILAFKDKNGKIPLPTAA